MQGILLYHAIHGLFNKIPVSEVEQTVWAKVTGSVYRPIIRSILEHFN